MKKNLLKALACLMLMCTVWSCNSESETVMSNADNNAREFTAKDRQGIWEGEIGVADEKLTITANRASLLYEFERLLAKKGETVRLTSISIQQRVAVNDSLHTAYFLIANGFDNNAGMAVSSGVVLNNMGGKFYLGSPISDGDPLDVSCRGCGSGCFLKYYVIGKDRVPYCDSAGCGPICDKIE